MAHEAERAATGLDWLLKGRKPKRMNPVRAVVPTKALSWREDNKRKHTALKQKGGKK
jgi:hypothetical protein